MASATPNERRDRTGPSRIARAREAEATATISRPRRPRGQRAFLKVLANTSNVRESCRQAKVTRSAVYVWRNRDEQFRAEWAEALEEGLDRVEMAGFTHAIAGDPRLIQFFLSRRRPKEYGRYRELTAANDAPDRLPQIIIETGEAPGERAPPLAEAE